MTVRAGDTQTAIIVITDAAGAVVTTAVIGDLTVTARFNAASHTLTGTTLTHLGSGTYQFTYTPPSTAGSLAGRLSHATWSISPNGFTETVEVYDLDAIAALATTTATLSAEAIVLQDVDLGDVVVGDSWRSAVLTVSQDLLDAWGLTNLATYTGKLSAAVRTGPTDTDQDAVTVTEVDLAANQVRLSWLTWPTTVVLASGVTEQTLYLDLQLVDPSATTTPKFLTLGRYTLTALWQRDTRTSLP